MTHLGRKTWIRRYGKCATLEEIVSASTDSRWRMRQTVQLSRLAEVALDNGRKKKAPK